MMPCHCFYCVFSKSSAWRKYEGRRKAGKDIKWKYKFSLFFFKENRKTKKQVVYVEMSVEHKRSKIEVYIIFILRKSTVREGWFSGIHSNEIEFLNLEEGSTLLSQKQVLKNTIRKLIRTKFSAAIFVCTHDETAFYNIKWHPTGTVVIFICHNYYRLSSSFFL